MDTSFLNRLPRALYRAEQVRILDRIAIEQLGIPGFTLMQRAGAAALDALLQQWPESQALLIFAGAGNNAGDAYVVAGLARQRSLRVELIAIADPDGLQGDAASAFQMAVAAGLRPISMADYQACAAEPQPQQVIVDGLLGTGLSRAPDGDFEAAITCINQADSPVVALDIPSGLSADTGMPLGKAVHADLTVSFIGMKRGLLTGQGRDLAGVIVFDDLDVPSELFRHADAPRPAARSIDSRDALGCLPVRPPSAHKGKHGHVLIVGGDLSFGGAGLMAAEAALRCGAGLVSVVTRSAHRPAYLARCPEIMVAGTEDASFSFESLLARASVCLIGPGLGRSSWGQKLFTKTLALAGRARMPLIIDADGLFHLQDRMASASTRLGQNWVLTPHPGEAANLLGQSTETVQADRFATLNALLESYGGAVLLKGSGSLIGAGDTPCFLCTEGNPGMASGGMGDVLGGVIAALIAQGLQPAEALRHAVCLHGEAGDMAAQQTGQRGLAATDLLPHLRELMNAPDQLP